MRPRGTVYVLACAASLLALAGTTHAVPVTIRYDDPPDQGFFDPTAGAARRAALEFAADRWGSLLAGTVPITVAVTMSALGGDGAGALLASGGATTIHRAFAGATPDTWYAAALANEVAGTDLNGSDTEEITIVFNADIDGPQALGSVAWYYGTDAQPGTDVDFVTVALHEMGHGLGFSETVEPQSGGWKTPNAQPGIFDRMLFRPEVGRFADVRDAERLAATISTPLLWDGPSLIAFNGQGAAVFTPDPFQPGASIAHWDPALEPGELMAPTNSGAVHDPGLLLPALVDMGWKLAVASPTPRASPATPAATATPTPSVPPATPPPRRDMVYVTNFDDGTVSVVDPRKFSVTATVKLDGGALGVAAAPDGRHVYVANFHTGTLSVVSTLASRVLTTIPVGLDPNGVAVTADGSRVIVTDTAANQAAVVDAPSVHVTARVAAGLQPSAIAIGPDGRLAFIADYGDATVTVIDAVTGLRRAIIPVQQPNLTGIAIARATGAGYVAFVAGELMDLNADTLTTKFFRFFPNPINEAMVIDPQGSTAYVAGHAADGTQGRVAVIDVATDTVVANAQIRNGLLPEAMALSTDGQTLYVTATGSNAVEFVNTIVRGVDALVSVGKSPMGVAVAAVPEFCNGDCNGDALVTVDELVRATAIALGQEAAAACVAVDRDADDRVTVDEIVAAVQNALSGCPAVSR